LHHERQNSSSESGKELDVYVLLEHMTHILQANDKAISIITLNATSNTISFLKSNDKMSTEE
jgi:hypothetical protein